MVAPWKNCLQSGWLLHQSLNLLARQMSQNGPHIAHDRITKQHETKSNKIKQRQQPCTARNHSGHDTLGAWQSGATFNVGKVWRNPHLKDLQCNVGCVLPASGTGQTPRQLHFRQLGGQQMLWHLLQNQAIRSQGLTSTIDSYSPNHSEKFKCLTSHPLHWAQVIRQAPAQKAAHEAMQVRT